MLWLPNHGTFGVIHNGGIVGSGTPGTGVPSNATTLLDGAVTELIASGSNTQDSWGIHIAINATGLAATASEAKMSILVGGATDDVMIPDLLCGCVGVAQGWREYFFPLHVPGGKRIAAVLCSVRTSITARCLVHLLGGGVPPFRVGRKVTALGTEINGARGKALSVNTSGGAALVTEMVASSAADYFALLPASQINDTTVAAAHYMNLGIGIGAATEHRLPGSWWMQRNTNEDESGPWPCWPVFADVPAGSRICMLASDSGSDAGHDGHIYAVS